MRTRALALVVLTSLLSGLTLASAAAPIASASVETHGWPMLGYDAAQTNYNPFETTLGVSNVGNLEFKWELGDENGWSWPIVADNGSLIASGDLNDANATPAIFAFDQAGTQLWAHTEGGPTTTDTSDLVYAYLDGLNAVDATSGGLAWSATCPGAAGQQKIIGAGRVFSHTAAIDAITGQCLAQFKRQVSAEKDGVLYGTNGGTLWATNTAGATFWHTRVSNHHRWHSIPVASGRFVYVPWRGGVRAFRATTGNRVWSSSFRERRFAPNMAVANGVLYVGGASGAVRALDAGTGEKLWRTHVRRSYTPPAVAVANGVVYVTTSKLDALDAASGSVLWRGPSTWAGRWSPPVIANGMVYVDGSTYDEADSILAFGLP